MAGKISHYLFAYGFLKTVYHGNTDTRTPPMDVEFVSSGLYQGQIYRLGRYPGIVFDEKAPYRVKGEVFRLRDPEKLLAVLDEYEHASPLVTEDPEYQRVLRKIKTESGFIECWVYEYLHSIDQHPVIESGEF